MNSSEQLPSKFSSLLKCKCPRCRKGDVFSHSASYTKRNREMHVFCPVCGMRFEMEVGFFWGAMYMGYALNVALSVTLGVMIFVLLGNPDAWVYISIIVAGIFLTAPWNFRYGRMILLYTFAPKTKDEPPIEREVNSKMNSKLN